MRMIPRPNRKIRVMLSVSWPCRIYFISLGNVGIQIQTSPEVMSNWNRNTSKTSNDSSDFMFSITQSNKRKDCIIEKVIRQIPLDSITDLGRIFKPARNVKYWFPEAILTSSSEWYITYTANAKSCSTHEKKVPIVGCLPSARIGAIDTENQATISIIGVKRMYLLIK